MHQCHELLTSFEVPLPFAYANLRIEQLHACKSCPFKYSNSWARSGNITDCKCTAGYTGPDGGLCEACAPGTAKVWGSGPCLRCAAGTFINKSAQALCEGCAVNFFSNKSGSSVCSACPATYFSLGNASNCSSCPVDQDESQGKQATLPAGCTPRDEGAVASAKALAALVSSVAAGAVAGAVAGGVAGGVGGGGAGGGAGGGGGGGGGAIQLVEQVKL